MNATQASLVVKQLLLVGPLVLTEAFPQIGISTAVVIFVWTTAFSFLILSPRLATNPLAIIARLLVSWVLSSSLMIIAAYLKI